MFIAKRYTNSLNNNHRMKVRVKDKYKKKNRWNIRRKKEKKNWNIMLDFREKLMIGKQSTILRQ